MSFPAVPKQKAFALCIALVLFAGLSCDRVTAPPTTGGIDLALSLESAVALQDVRVTVQGPTTQTLTFGAPSGAAMSVSVAELPPGMYSVSVAGLVGGRVAQFGETSGIAVAVGANRSANVALSGFQPVVSTLPDTVNVLHFNVSYSAVPHATSYMVEWSKSPAMTDASSAVVTGTNTEITVAEEGQYYFAVRAANDAVTVEGLPSPTRPIFVMQVVSSVTVLPLSPSIVDGTTQLFTATARDQDNAVISNPTLYWASSNQLVATTNQNGLVTAVGPGQTTITAIAKGTPGSATLTVTSQAASKLVFTAPPTNTTAGQTIAAIKVAIQNPKGEVATSDDVTQVTLQISANPGSGALSGTATATVVDGVATFSNLSINRSGTGYTLQATTGAALTSATSGAFNILPGAATQLALVVQPTNATAGAAISPAVQVELRDGLGNRVVAARDPVTLQFVANPGSGTLSGATVVNAIDGIASFSGVSVDKAGTGYTVRATSGSLTATSTSSAFNISAAAAEVLAFTTQPSNASTDDVISAQVAVRDRFGNLVSSAPPVTVTLGVEVTGVSLTGTTTQPVIAGLATFTDLRINVHEQGYTLVAQSGSLKAATSNAFDMSPGAPAKLAFLAQPTNAEPQGPINEVRVAILDAQDNVTGVAENITLALSTNPGGATLCCTLTVQTSNGMASFTDLTLDKTGAGYKLSASSGGLPDATSGAFDVAVEFVDVTAGDYNSCGLTVNGSAYCWGLGFVGGLGDGVGGSDAPSPVRVIGGYSFSSISTGFAHSCGIRADNGAAICWGWNSFGQLGNGVVGPQNNPTPVEVVGGHTFVAISAGMFHTCGLDQAGIAWCWGDPTWGRLGDNTTGGPQIPTPTAVFGSQVFNSISAGYEHTCAIQASDLAAYCWGRQFNGRLGNNQVADISIGTPQLVQGGFQWLEISAGQHTCGVRAPTTDRRGYCWGLNANGQLGVAAGDFTERSAPTLVANSLRFANLSAGHLQSCGATVGGSGFCWGLADLGRLGNGEMSGNRETPRAVLGSLSFTVIRAATGSDNNGNHSCGLASTGAYCWGSSNGAAGGGFLGDGSFFPSSTPVKVRGQR